MRGGRAIAAFPPEQSRFCFILESHVAYLGRRKPNSRGDWPSSATALFGGATTAILDVATFGRGNRCWSGYIKRSPYNFEGVATTVTGEDGILKVTKM